MAPGSWRGRVVPGGAAAGRPRTEWDADGANVPPPGGYSTSAHYAGSVRTAETCVNHPDVETRLSCSTCGDPICTRCMRTAAVGQKCPRCARTPRSARALGRPVHYVRAIGAGLSAAVVGGAVYAQLLATVSFGRLVLAGALGYGIGRVVRWGTAGQTQQPFAGIAIALGVVAIGVGFVTATGTPLPPGAGILTLAAYPLAGWLALRGLQR